jgi:hypothetical protein
VTPRVSRVTPEMKAFPSSGYGFTVPILVIPTCLVSSHQPTFGCTDVIASFSSRIVELRVGLQMAAVRPEYGCPCLICGI